jgi:FlaA1/EpsC-like NDP-sugar epimerase
MDGVDVVIHAAALKHVSFCEYNPIEAVKTNIEGSINVIEAALDRKVEKVLAISTDKAVNPVNIYGASKLCMEKLFLDANVYGGKFSVVRSGNFFGSRGSAIPLWREQAQHGKITVTDKNMERYFIDIGDMANFILRCLDLMQGKEIFVPDMRLENIDALTTQMFPGVEKEYIGRQEGEKLFEEIMTEDEKSKAQKIEGGFVVRT